MKLNSREEEEEEEEHRYYQSELEIKYHATGNS